MIIYRGLALMAFFGIGPCLAYGQTGSVEIRVRLEEPDPGLPTIVTNKNEDFCGNTLSDPILLVKQQMVANVVAYLDWPEKVQTEAKHQPIHLKSNHCLLSPRVQTARAGVFLHLNSGDEITHNPHGWWNDEITVFNITLLDPSMSFKRRLRHPGKYRIDCDTHTWMKAYIWAFDHPYFTLTDQNGSAIIEGIPTGEHRIRLWHEVLGEKEGKVVVTKDKTSAWETSFVLSDHRPDELKPQTKVPWPKSDGE